MKEKFFAITGAVGAGFAALFGGWTSALGTLLVFMAIDYITGLIVAGVFHASKKTENGALESRAGWKGLCRKGMTLLIVYIAARIDLMLETSYFRDGTAIAFIVNELLSIVENAGLMGVPMPEAVTKAIAILKEKGE